METIKPKEAVSKLWEGEFFKKHKETSDVAKKSLDDYGCTCSNWSALLNTCKFLRKDKKKWIQKYNAIKKEESLSYITGKTPWTDRNERFIKFIRSLEGEIFILDPYYGLDTLHLLSKFPKTTKINFLTSQLGRDENEEIIKKEISRFKREFKNVSIRIYQKFYELHDRYILSENVLTIIGHGLKDIGNKECFLISIPKQEVTEIYGSLKKNFKERWDISQKLI